MVSDAPLLDLDLSDSTCKSPPPPTEGKRLPRSLFPGIWPRKPLRPVSPPLPKLKEADKQETPKISAADHVLGPTGHRLTHAAPGRVGALIASR